MQNLIKKSDCYQIIRNYKEGVIQVLNMDTSQQLIIPYRIELEGGGSFMSNLKMLRKTNNITQRALSKETGIPYSSIVNYENGRRTPTGRSLCILARYFGVDAESLLGIDMNKIERSQSNENS